MKKNDVTECIEKCSCLAIKDFSGRFKLDDDVSLQEELGDSEENLGNYIKAEIKKVPFESTLSENFDEDGLVYFELPNYMIMRNIDEITNFESCLKRYIESHVNFLEFIYEDTPTHCHYLLPTYSEEAKTLTTYKELCRLTLLYGGYGYEKSLLNRPG